MLQAVRIKAASIARIPNRALEIPLPINCLQRKPSWLDRAKIFGADRRHFPYLGLVHPGRWEILTGNFRIAKCEVMLQGACPSGKVGT